MTVAGCKVRERARPFASGAGRGRGQPAAFGANGWVTREMLRVRCGSPPGSSARSFILNRGIGESSHIFMTLSHASHLAVPLSRAGGPQFTA